MHIYTYTHAQTYMHMQQTNTPPEKNTRGKSSLRAQHHGGGERFLLPDRAVSARANTCVGL